MRIVILDVILCIIFIEYCMQLYTSSNRTNNGIKAVILDTPDPPISTQLVSIAKTFNIAGII